MREGNLVETAKFAIVVILAFVAIAVPALLLQPAQNAKIFESQAQVVTALSGLRTIPPSRRVLDSTVYRLPGGGSVVFVEAVIYRSRVACALLLNASYEVQKVQVLSPIALPGSLRLEQLLAQVGSSRRIVPASILSYEERAFAGDILRMFKKAAEVSRKAGTS